MDNRNILDLGSIISGINLGTAAKLSGLFQEKEVDQGDTATPEKPSADDKERAPIGDYEVTYQELCRLLENIKQKWHPNDADQIVFNAYYQRDLLYLYDRITLDMSYLKENPDRNNEWLAKLLELKYEIRNLL